MTNENTDSSNCCDSSAELHPTVQVGPCGDWRASESWSGNCAHVVLEGPTELVQNQIFPGAAIGLEPQDLKMMVPKHR